MLEWTGPLLAPVSGGYRFTTMSDDGVEVWVNDQLVIGNWNDHGPTTDTSKTIRLTAGVKYRHQGAVLRALVLGDHGIAMDDSRTDVDHHPIHESIPVVSGCCPPPTSPWSRCAKQGRGHL